MRCKHETETRSETGNPEGNHDHHHRRTGNAEIENVSAQLKSHDGETDSWPDGPGAGATASAAAAAAAAEMTLLTAATLLH